MASQTHIEPVGADARRSLDTGEGDRIEGMLQVLSEGTAAAIGEDFFKSLSMHLATAFHVRYAFVTTCTDASKKSVRTLAFWKGDRFADNFEYPLDATPCQHVIGGNVLQHEDAIQELFPHDDDLRELGARGYLGVPIPDAAGRVIGHIAVLDDRPMRRAASDVAIIKIFAARAGAEIQRQQAEEARRESEERFRSGFHNARIGMAMTGGHGEFRSVNKAFCDMLGYTEDEMLRTDIQTITEPEDVAASVDLVGEVISGKRDAFQLEKRYRHKTGRTVWAITSASVVRDRDGSPAYLFAQIQDITERKRAEQAVERARAELELRVRQRTDELSVTNAALQEEIQERRRIAEALEKSEHAYRDFYMDAPNIYISTGVDGLIKRANRKAAELFGYDLDAFLGKPILSLVAPTPQGQVRAKRVFARFLAGEEVQAEEIEFVKADRSNFWGAVSVKPYRNAEGQIEATRSIIVDITARKRVEQALRHRIAMEELLAQISARFISIATSEIDDAITESVGQIGQFSDSDHAFVSLICEDGISAIKTHAWFAEGAERTTNGHNVDDNPSLISVLRHISEDRVLHVPSVAALAVDEGAIKSYMEERRVRSMAYVPMRLRNRPLGFLGLETQRREKRWSTEDIRLLRMMGESLVHAIERRDVEVRLQEAKEAAEAANRAKSEFLANMSHELRTPLNGILGYAQILVRDENLTEAQRDGLEVIGRSGEHLLTLINDVLDLSKIEAGMLEVQRSEFHLHAFLKDIADAVGVRADQKGLAFRYEIASRLPERIVGDERRLRQVLLNLLGNAVKFTEHGHVVLRAGCGDEGASSKRLCFEVEDTGIGIAPEDIESIFQPFLQVGMARHRIEGTGLGLAISKRLVRLMGGTLGVESQPGKGSLFRIELDVSTTGRVRTLIPTERPAVRGYKGEVKRVLLVDDRPVNRSVLTGLLEPLGFVLLEAVDGRDALTKYVAFKPDAVLMDLVMPVMDGFEATRRLRMLPSEKHVVVIALSASVFEHNRLQSFEAGCDDFLQKPVKLASLLNCLEMHLNIEWLLDESPLEVVVARESRPATETEMKLPTAAAIRTLFKFARMGHVHGILSQLDEVERASAEYVSFVAHLRTLARDADMKSIRRFLEPHLGEGDGD